MRALLSPVVVAGALSAVAIGAGCSTPNTGAATASRGERFFQTKCNACHPGGGQGAGPPIELSIAPERIGRVGPLFGSGPAEQPGRSPAGGCRVLSAKRREDRGAELPGQCRVQSGGERSGLSQPDTESDLKLRLPIRNAVAKSVVSSDAPEPCGCFYSQDTDA